MKNPPVNIDPQLPLSTQLSLIDKQLGSLVPKLKTIKDRNKLEQLRDAIMYVSKEIIIQSHN